MCVYWLTPCSSGRRGRFEQLPSSQSKSEYTVQPSNLCTATNHTTCAYCPTTQPVCNHQPHNLCTTTNHTTGVRRPTTQPVYTIQPHNWCTLSNHTGVHHTTTQPVYNHQPHNRCSPVQPHNLCTPSNRCTPVQPHNLCTTNHNRCTQPVYTVQPHNRCTPSNHTTGVHCPTKQPVYTVQPNNLCTPSNQTTCVQPPTKQPVYTVQPNNLCTPSNQTTCVQPPTKQPGELDEPRSQAVKIRCAAISQATSKTLSTTTNQPIKIHVQPSTKQPTIIHLLQHQPNNQSKSTSPRTNQSQSSLNNNNRPQTQPVRRGLPSHGRPVPARAALHILGVVARVLTQGVRQAVEHALGVVQDLHQGPHLLVEAVRHLAAAGRDDVTDDLRRLRGSWTGGVGSVVGQVLALDFDLGEEGLGESSMVRV